MLVYKWTNKHNGKVYVGQTTQTLRQRTKGHKNSAASGSNLPIHNAIRKYGMEAFIIEEIATSETLDGLNALEIHYIKLLNSIVPNGYNLNGGGFNHNQHPETRAKISVGAKKRISKDNGAQFKAMQKKGQESLKGVPSWNKGLKATEEAIKNQSKAHIGQPAWNKGARTPDEVKEKQRLAAKSRSKIVICAETNQVWPSIEACAKEVGLSTTHINRLIKSGQSHKKSGLTFRFCDNKPKEVV